MHATEKKKTQTQQKPTRKTALGKWWIRSLLHVHSFQAQSGASYKVQGLEFCF